MFSMALSVAGNEATRITSCEVLFPIERTIASRIYGIALQGNHENREPCWSKDRYWTERVRSELRELGEKEGWLVLPREVDKSSEGEWLVDVAWLSAAKPEEIASWRRARSMILACECEWKTSESSILEDFLKLAFLTCDLRVFLYTNEETYTDHPGRGRVAQLCFDATPISRGLRYLLLGVPGHQNRGFLIDSWTA
jgi:hypothetical protein